MLNHLHRQVPHIYVVSVEEWLKPQQTFRTVRKPRGPNAWVNVTVGVLRHPPTTFPLQPVLTQAVYLQATRNSHGE